MRSITARKRIFVASCPVAVALFFVCVARTDAADLSGTYFTTQVIYENSQLTGDVTCAPTLTTAPCIFFGASHIKLSLNGFTITGPVDPKTNVAACSKPTDPAFGVGVEVIDQDNIVIEGPGVIQHFERWGILIRSSSSAHYVTHETVKDVTGTYNCWSGLQTGFVSDSRFERNVWANNAIGSNGAACGGLCLNNSNRNIFSRSTYYGNGSVDYPNGNVDFGIGLEGSSSDNVIEENDIGGNTNGVMFFNTVSNNLVRRNIIAGNPAAQVVKTFTAPNQQGADITFRPVFGGANNVFEDNFCLTYQQGGGPATAPCPNITTHGVERADNRDVLPAPGNGGNSTDGADIFAVGAVALAIAFRRLVVG
jgi:parallel beta-helix repeat protein